MKLSKSTLRIRIVIVLVISYFFASYLTHVVFTKGDATIDRQGVEEIQNIPIDFVSTIFTLFKQKQIQSKSDLSGEGSGWITAVPISPTSLPTLLPLPTELSVTPIPPVTTKKQIVPTQTPTQIPTPYRPPTSIPTQPTSPQITTLADFGKCLNSKGYKMYTQPGCSACTQQKKILGSALQHISEVDCPTHQTDCANVGVRTTPTWASNGKMVIPGYASLDQLSSKSGCALPTS